MAKTMLAAIKDELSRETRAKCWVDSMPAAVQKELEEIRSLWHAGEINPRNISRLHAAVQKHLKEKAISLIGRESFARWLKRSPKS